MLKRKKNKKKALGPVIMIIVLIFIIVLSSAFFSAIGITGDQTYISNGSLETSLTTVNNLLTKDGIKYIFTNAVINFQVFEPLVLLIISLITISIGEASGLFKAVFTPLKRLNNNFLTFLVLLIGIVSSFFGEYSYMFLLPLVAVVYQLIGKKPLLGVITMFIAITMGYGTGLVYNNDEVILSILTQQSASIDVDVNYMYSLTSNAYIMFVSTFVLAFIGTFIINSTLDKKIPKSNIEEEDKLVVSKKGLHYSNLAFIIMFVIVIYAIIPGLTGSGILLGEGNTYIERLLGNDAPFSSGIMFIIMGIMMICGFVYGYTSGNIKNSTEYSVALSKSFEGLGYVFVLLFFVSQMVGILEYSNLGPVIATNIISFISSLTVSGIPIIIMFFIAIILISILIPSAEAKWNLVAPLSIPLLMRANVTPSFSQFVFRVADGIGKSFTPFFVYYIIMLAFLEKYNTKENTKITVFGILKTILPTLLLFTALWLVIILCWYLLGVHTGPGVYSTF